MVGRIIWSVVPVVMRLCLHLRKVRRVIYLQRRKVSLVILFMIIRRVKISLSSRAWKASAIEGVSLVK